MLNSCTSLLTSIYSNQIGLPQHQLNNEQPSLTYSSAYANLNELDHLIPNPSTSFRSDTYNYKNQPEYTYQPTHSHIDPAYFYYFVNNNSFSQPTSSNTNPFRSNTCPNIPNTTSGHYSTDFYYPTQVQSNLPNKRRKMTNSAAVAPSSNISFNNTKVSTLGELDDLVLLKRNTQKSILEIERQKRNELLQQVINSWLKFDQTPVTLTTVDEILNCIKGTIELVGRRYSQCFLLPIVIYADKFVKQSGLIEQEHVLNLLLIATVVTVKFWVDTGVDLDVTSYVSGISKKTISMMERNFLSIIDYALFLSTEEIEAYKLLAVN